ncbi:hypothetical protein C8039_00055 [Halogeometricum sp. wsp3]|nr:hypothetical protein C8039_00055 [Halogeometricum sp. wsp3]
MPTDMSERETWATRAGFILAAVGSAVGLGNIWQFPFKTATVRRGNIPCLIPRRSVGIGFPAMLAEFIIGRRTNRMPSTRSGNSDSSMAARRWHWRLTPTHPSMANVVGGWVGAFVRFSTGAHSETPRCTSEPSRVGRKRRRTGLLRRSVSVSSQWASTTVSRRRRSVMVLSTLLSHGRDGGLGFHA